MTTAQKHALRLSEIRQRLNTIGGLEGDAYDEAVQNEERALMTELDTTEVRYRNALKTEGAEAATAQGQFGPTATAKARKRGRSWGVSAWLTTWAPRLLALAPGVRRLN